MKKAYEHKLFSSFFTTMSNTTNLAILASIGGTAFNILSQALNPNKESINLEESVKVGMTIGALGALGGAIADYLHEDEWDNASAEEQKKIRVWKKAKEVPLRNPYVVRRDKYGNEIHFDEYGNRSSKRGWEKDHSKPKSKGGHPTHINNLQPLQWNENAQKGEKYPYRKQKLR